MTERVILRPVGNPHCPSACSWYPPIFRGPDQHWAGLRAIGSRRSDSSRATSTAGPVSPTVRKQDDAMAFTG